MASVIGYVKHFSSDQYNFGGVYFTTILVGGVVGYILANNFTRSDESDEKDVSDEIVSRKSTSLRLDSHQLIRLKTQNIVPGGPSPINLDNDEVLNYYLKNVDISNPKWREDPSETDSKDKNTPDEWIHRHPAMVRLTGRHPFNSEAPLNKLFDKGWITPVSLHYVRNHALAPQISWESHRIHITGLCSNPYILSMNDLLTKFHHRSLPVTLVCCGNRRKEQNMIKQTIGFNWGAGGCSTGVWTGVRLCDILNKAGITEFKTGLHVRFASEHSKGGDKLPGGVYGTSVPLARALDPSFELMIAFMYNGEMLRPDHGFPVRLIVPGYIGGRMIKWITDITIMDTESQDYYHFFDNRVLPSHVDAEMSKAEGWWYRPEYICNDLNVNSAIARPDNDEVLTVTAADTAVKGFSRSYRLEGYAYAGGGRRITRTEISLDSGATWKLCTLKVIERPTEYGKHWCWVFWELPVLVSELQDAIEIILRAWDEGFNTQPMKPTWNVMGMLNNPCFRIKIRRKKLDNGDLQLKFEHPTLAGTQSGGWMAKLKEHPSLTDPALPHEGYPVSHLPPGVYGTGFVDSPIALESESTKVQNVAFDPSKPSYTMAEVNKHNSAESVWIVVKNRVYDCTPFLSAHPGGADSILLNAGIESTEEFEAIHSKKAWKMLEDYYIGQLRPGDVSSEKTNGTADTSVTNTSESSEGLIALNPKQRIPFKLMKREVLSSDSLRLRFALQSPKHVLGLPVGQHMFFSAKVDGKLVMRAYTPTSSDHDVGYFDLVIKVYSPCTAFPEGGKMSQYLGNLKVGESIDVKGPLGHVTYEGRGKLILNHIPFKVRKFAMLCGGTGITPMFQVIKAILRDDQDNTEIFMLYGNRTENDILLEPELNEMALNHPKRLHMLHVLSRPKSKEPKKGTVYGRMSASMIRDFIPPGSEEGAIALMCGPPALLDDVCAPALKEYGYSDDRCVYF
mmetsp:Transcript_32947/g.33559  ORF Transcript_32947/g.33559 Transcript_32947/m.33559 type:complete len:960 (+) Transcript_32947:91-2970(+)|eukprot:CAMPEP_0182427188 /NCGR_PEP_ID=MMETSP1167-20130531/15488_1 /TAXON_ID=2988 /ORGANISM="Mallomonas Sp, Strain CCMP3275" /LENGTH=959 /DNA_ID=CAMNT_0024609223 /DNA_START=75 /DNA_END=2954 /DNA_ORIENTATION=+